VVWYVADWSGMSRIGLVFCGLRWFGVERTGLAWCSTVVGVHLIGRDIPAFDPVNNEVNEVILIDSSMCWRCCKPQ
jgi:hypothetical protein